MIFESIYNKKNEVIGGHNISNATMLVNDLRDCINAFLIVTEDQKDFINQATKDGVGLYDYAEALLNEVKK